MRDETMLEMAAEHIAAALRLAREGGEPLLGYILEMALLEAQNRLAAEGAAALPPVRKSA